MAGVVLVMILGYIDLSFGAIVAAATIVTAITSTNYELSL